MLVSTTDPRAASPDGVAMTIPDQLARAAERWPDRPALAGVDGDPAQSQRELHELVTAQAERLRAWGIGRGDVVLLALPDGPMAFAALLAIASVATVLPVAAREQPEEYTRILDEVPVRAILMEERPNAPLRHLADERGLMLLTASPARRAPGTFVLSVVRPGAGRPAEPPELDDDVLYTLTSGTTSIPKIVAMTHRSLWLGLEGSRRWYQLTEHDRSLCLMPIAHLHSLLRCSLPIVLNGGSVVWAPGFDAGRVTAWLDRFEPSIISAAPAIHRKLVGVGESAGWQPRRGVPRLFSASSDKLDAPTIASLERLFGASVVQLYGLSETSPLIAGTALDDPPAPPGSTGRINPAWAVVCVDPDGVPVGPGEVGEIALSGGIVNRLVGRSAAGIQRYDDEGRFLTGDLGRIDEDGHLFVEGRVDDVINRGGQKIHPAAVESAIASHPAVRAVAAFASPDAVLGSRVAAVVELRAGQTVTIDELLEHAGQHLRSYMVPERVLFAETIPRNDLGKLSRRDLSIHYSSAPSEAAATPAPAGREPDEAVMAAAGLTESVLEVYRRVLRRPDIDPDTSFFDLGGDSLHSLYVLLELEERFGLNVPPATFARLSAASTMAAYLAQQDRTHVSAERLTEIQSGQRGPTLVAVHGADGRYNHLAVSLTRLGLAPGVPIVAVSSATHDGLPDEPDSLAGLARGYASLVGASVPGRIVVAGFSLGAHIALATASQLIAQDSPVDLVVLIDDDAELDRRHAGAGSEPLVRESIEGFYRDLVAREAAAPFAGSALLIHNEEDEADYRSDPTAGWGEVALGSVEVVVVPGNHHSIVEQERLPAIAHALMRALETIRSAPSGAVVGPDEVRRLRYEARVAGVRGAPTIEIARYREAIAIAAEQPSWVYANLAGALFDVGDLDESSRALDEAFARDPWPLSIARRSVAGWVATGQSENVERALLEARRAVADHASVFQQRGEVLLAASQLAEAEASFREGLAMNAEHFRLHRGLAEVLRRQRRFAEAAAVLAEANEQTPGLGWLVVIEAEALLDAGDPAGALEVLERRKALVDDAYRGRLVRGRVLEALGRSDEARADLSERVAGTGRAVA